MLEVAEEQKMLHLFLPFSFYNIDEHFKRFMKELYIDLLNLIPHGNMNIKYVHRKGRQFLFLCHIPSTIYKPCPSAVLQASGFSRFSSTRD